MEGWVLGLMMFPFLPAVMELSMLYLPLVLAVYLVPLWVAIWRGHPNRVAIGLLNVLLGWMMPGWVAALVWASLVRRGDATGE